MELEAVKKYLEKGGAANEEGLQVYQSAILGLRSRFFDRFVMEAITLDLIEKGHLRCSMKVTPNLLNESHFLHGGAIATVVDMVGAAAITSCGVLKTGVSVEINVSYMDAAYENEEIEIEATVPLAGKNFGVASVELRKKKTGKPVAQGRHTKYFGITSKL